ncbi:hypothetical protein [Frankia sp. R43]|uniref:tyrosine-type recombinase/integrase n=1 Tax=Frankia sp. R43 TaxID=269536 RepID=UPI0006C9EA2B|nr:hypothetical protein [Frankia sp. R43]
MASFEKLPARSGDGLRRIRVKLVRAHHRAPTDQTMWRPIFDTKAAARSWVVKAEKHLDYGHVPDCLCESMSSACTGLTTPAPPVEPPKPAAETLTLTTWRERWWPTYCRSTRKAARSIEETDRRWRLHLEPRWGESPLAAFDRLDIQDWVDEELAGWKAPGTVELIYKDLQLLLSAAADNRPPILTYNPCYKIRLPEGNGAEAIHTDTAGIARIADRCDFYRDLVWCLYGSGWRWAEMAGLRDDLVVTGNRDADDNGPCIDREAGVLRIHPELGCLVESSGSLASGPPKTRGSARTTPVPEFVFDMIDARLDVMPKKGERDSFVWHGPRGGLLRRSGFNRRVWRPACDGREEEPKRRGTPGRPAWDPLVPGMKVHGIRHSHKAVLEAAGIPDSAIEARLGHSRGGRGISGVYSHVLPETEDRIVKVLQSRYEAAILL